MIFTPIFFQDALGGLGDVTVSVANGKITCSFLRDAVTVIQTPVEESEEVTIDLNSNEYFVELATGPLDDNNEYIAPHKDQDVSESPFMF